MSHNPNVYAPGVPSKNVGIAPIEASRAPVSSDISHPLGQPWIDKSSDIYYVLTDLTAGVATWVNASSLGSLTQIDGDSGSATPTAGVVNVIGTAAQIDSTAASDTVTLSLIGPYTPATYTDNGVLVGSGASSITALSVGSDGQLLVGATGADPAFATLASADGSVAFTTGANTLDLSADTAASQSMKYADVTLTSTEIKALATTPIELVAAPAAGASLLFMGALFKLNYGSNVFTEGGDNLGIKFTNAAGFQVSNTIETTGFIDQSADTQTNAIPAADAIVASASAEAAALVLDNLGSNIAGNAADDSTLTVRTYYLVQSL